MLVNDPLANVLYIDLTRKRFYVQRREDLFERYLGGVGVATRLLLEECPEGVDPLAPDNPIIFAVGPLTGLFPLASKTVAMFKSPHTGNLGESHAGGRSAVAIRMAGFGAIVIKGANDSPGYVAIDNGQVHFRDATTLWGMKSGYTVGRVIRENEGGAGTRTIMRIGRAGEKRVTYAGVTTETYRHFGRMGLGAVFGSKMLKAVVVSGKRTLGVSDRREYRRMYDEIYKTATTSPLMKKYHDLGTPENVLPLDAIGGLPTRNLQAARMEGADQISGEAFAKNYLGRRLACAHCPVGCIHIAALREPYPDKDYFFKTSMVSYDYEPIYALGTMLGINHPEGLLRLMDDIEAWGLDAMSAGVVLAWATEAQERGLVSEAETGGIRLAWGDHAAYSAAAGMILEQPNDFYRALARGVDHAASIYGGREFALTYGKNEMSGYHTGPGAHLGFLLGTRHSHLDSAGYSIDQKVLPQRQVSPEEMVDMLVKEERWRQVLSSMVVCFFARGIYDMATTVKTLRMAGMDVTADGLLELGAQIHRDKIAFKVREGFSYLQAGLPKRIFETESPVGRLDEAYMRRAIEYFQARYVQGVEEKEPVAATL
ncbi:MAG TPA: aldehyde ferredoxin oxidoreductase family protein [Chloroflexi bacterium]|nr:aldehyde ferredoxin oxidoreductase family protein [Chloroflexota bacterium]